MRLHKGKIFFRSKCKFLRFAGIFIVTVIYTWKAPVWFR